MQTDTEVRQPAAIERNKAIVLKFYGERDLKVQGDLLAPEFVGRAPGVPRFDRAGFLRGLADLYAARSEEHTSELQSRTLISYAVFCLKKKKTPININNDILQISLSYTTQTIDRY